MAIQMVEEAEERVEVEEEADHLEEVGEETDRQEAMQMMRTGEMAAVAAVET